jgi:hypothetical protein
MGLDGYTRPRTRHTRIPRYHRWAFPADRIGIEEFIYLIHHYGKLAFEVFLDGHLGQA